jgi:hypothetical protein
MKLNLEKIKEDFKTGSLQKRKLLAKQTIQNNKTPKIYTQ